MLQRPKCCLKNRKIIVQFLCIVFFGVVAGRAYAHIGSTNACVSDVMTCANCSCMDYVKPECQLPVSFTFRQSAEAICSRFGRPVSPPKIRLATGGIYQDFEHGQIGTYSKWASGSGNSMPNFVLRASWPQTGLAEVDWASTAPYRYEYFKVHLTVDDEKKEKVTEAEVQKWPSSGDHTFNLAGATTYLVEIEGCDYPDSCPHGRSNPIYLENLSSLATFIEFVPGRPPPNSPPGTIGPPAQLHESVPLKEAYPPMSSPGKFLDVPDTVVITDREVEPLLKSFCDKPLLAPKSDDKHGGEIEDGVLLAFLGLIQLKEFCGSSGANDFASRMAQDINRAVVISRPGTDVERVVHVAILIAVGSAIGAAILALVLAAGGIFIGPVPPVLAAILFAITGGLLGAELGDRTYHAGDYDMRLLGIIRAYYEFGTSLDNVDPKLRAYIADHLLTVNGPASKRVDYLKIYELPTPVPETENHLWMTESARYLTNNILSQRLKDAGKAVPKDLDNDQNGMTAYLLQRMQNMLVKDSYEINARPYDRLTYAALVNLVDFATAYSGPCFVVAPPGMPSSPTTCDVARAARNCLDFQTAKFAAGSNELRRAAPFRRKPEFRDYPRFWTTGGDDLTWRHFGLIGGSSEFKRDRYYRLMQGSEGILIDTYQAAYRPPVMVTDLLRYPPGSSPYLQSFHATERDTNEVEIYYRDRDYLISAGGHFDPGTGFVNAGLHDIDALTFNALELAAGEDGWTQPTTLMPTLEGSDTRDFVRIAGSTDPRKRINTCVAPGFACGMNPVLPAGLPEACQIHKGNWTFINFHSQSSTCPLDYGFYVVFYKKPCGNDVQCKEAAGNPSDGGSFGFFEAVPAWPWDFQVFVDQASAANSNWRYEYSKVNEYASLFTPFGKTTFQLSEESNLWPIVSYGPTSMQTKPERRLVAWPVTAGGLMSTPMRACIYIDNRRLGQRLILDHTDVLHPRRAIVKPSMECVCPLSNACLNPSG
jgi:hypothetical protein